MTDRRMEFVTELHGDIDDEAYPGVLSFLSRHFTRDLAGVDVVITALAGATIMYQVLHLLALDKPVAPAMHGA
jgi:hypothetical protein